MPDFSLENQIKGIIAGVDEVGRGPWAGPVKVCAAIINQALFPPHIVPLINDSKKLTSDKRQVAHDLLTALPREVFCYNIASASVEEIDRLNIRQATLLAMSRAIAGLTIKPDHCLIDGNALPDTPIASTCVIKGDAISLSIAAASIVAKVSRDQLMSDLAKQYPQYKWERNAGYGTKAHQDALNEYGITPHHRTSFKPVQLLINRET